MNIYEKVVDNMEKKRQYNATLKDIAQKTGFTINTVSRALKDKDDISAPTKKLIREAADELGYVRDSIAGSLRTGFTKTIGVILGDVSNPHFSIMIKGIDKQAYKYKYNIIIFNTDEDETVELQSIRSSLSIKVDGIIICPTQKCAFNIDFLERTGIPFVLIGRKINRDRFNFVVMDDEAGGYIAAKHLIDNGHKRILTITGPQYISSAIDRTSGYKRALTENGIKIDNKLICETGIQSGACYKRLKNLIKNNLNFTAIFAFSDMIACEAIYTLNELGLSVPKDISIVGFDNIQEHMLLPVPLDTISAMNTRMPEVAVDVLIKTINTPTAVEKQQ
ncbi:MAG: LacI family transcriptional regulator, partial [Clostridiaceae bacterium]|nr:LacI family transcriptional regulator [Clostridiaceae bacterium]